MAFKRISINGPQFYEEILLPSFGDFITDLDVRNGFFGEFQVMDDVTDSRKIIDISPVRNILERRDASCTLTYKPVGLADVRRISVTDLYAATKFCRQEFYQGCLKDWRNNDPSFMVRILAFFKKAIREDMISNLYFGDVERASAAGDTWSHNKFDGIYTQFKKFIASGRIPGSQTFNIADGDITPANSIVYFESLIAKQDEYMQLVLDSEKSFTIDQQWHDAYEQYLIATGATNGEAVNYVQDGIKVRAYKGIPIFVNKLFRPVLKQITGDASPHFGYLTLRQNFIFATDKEYGEGPSGKEALVIWYDWDEMTWKYNFFVKAGTGIGLPEHSTIALPA